MNFGKLSFTGFPVQFSTPLGGVAWAVLAGIPVGIIALYFLKLRRRPVQVPSTLLWRRSLEDLHVNSLFQRLRRNLLLFLQLLAVLLAMLALAGPRVNGTTGQGQRFVLAIDNSASMSATDVAPSRLARPRRRPRRSSTAMERTTWRWSSPSPTGAKVVSNYTGDRAAAPAPDRRDRADRGARPRSARRSRSPPGWPTRRSRSARGSSPRRSSRPS